MAIYIYIYIDNSGILHIWGDVVFGVARRWVGSGHWAVGTVVNSEGCIKLFEHIFSVAAVMKNSLVRPGRPVNGPGICAASLRRLAS